MSFTETTDCEKVKQDVDGLLTNILGANYRLAITTTDTETKFALLKFPSFDEKIKFYKKMNECKKDGKLPEGVSFRDNLDFADRVTNKHLGYAKHFLMEHYNKASSQVQIHWKKTHCGDGWKKCCIARKRFMEILQKRSSCER